MAGYGDMIGNVAGKAFDSRMAQGQNTGNFGNQGGYQKFMGMAGSQPPPQSLGQTGMGQPQGQPGMDQQFGSLMQMLMQSPQNGRRR